MADFYTLLTNAGIAYENACKAAGVPIKLTQMSVGDGNGAVYNPAATATALKREVWRGPLNALFQDEKNPNWLLAEVTIPPEVGGWYVREAGLWTDTGILYAIVKYPESFKPVLATSGSGKEFYIRSIFETSNAAQVTLLIDDTVVKATRAWVASYVADEIAKLDYKQSVRVATTANIVLSGSQLIDGVAVVAGDRVLVKNQTQAKDNGIWVAAVGAWARAKDADASAEVTSALIVSVEQGNTLADTIWQLVTDGGIVLGSTPLVFQNITQGFALLDSPNFIGNPTAPTAPVGANSPSIATTAFVQAALAALVDSSPAALDTLKELAAALGNDPNFATTVTNALSLKAPLESPALTGNPTAPTPAAGDNDSSIATTAFVSAVQSLLNTAINARAPLASPALTGSPTAPTQAGTDSTTKLATTAQVQAAIIAAFSARVLGSVGYQRLPGGLIVQWGEVTVSATGGSYQAFSFPFRFPGGCAVAVGGRKSLGSNAVMLVGQSGGDPSGQVIFQNFGATAEIGQYIAIGY